MAITKGNTGTNSQNKTKVGLKDAPRVFLQ